jgi:hypothetical protein
MHPLGQPYRLSGISNADTVICHAAHSEVRDLSIPYIRGFLRFWKPTDGGWRDYRAAADHVLDGLNHGPFGEKNFLIPEGDWRYGLSRGRGRRSDTSPGSAWWLRTGRRSGGGRPIVPSSPLRGPGGRAGRRGRELEPGRSLVEQAADPDGLLNPGRKGRGAADSARGAPGA